MKILVTGLRSYSFQNQDGQTISGAKINYYSEVPCTKSNEVGYLPLQPNVSLDIVSQLSVVPGLYEAKFDMVPGRNNKPELIISGFELIKEVDFSLLFDLNI